MHVEETHDHDSVEYHDDRRCRSAKRHRRRIRRPLRLQQQQHRLEAHAPAGDAKFINSQNADQWLSSSFIGVDVIGPDDGKIGDVSDLLFDKNGNIVGYVVGVGGFLGIGAKNVALAPTSFRSCPPVAVRLARRQAQQQVLTM